MIITEPLIKSLWSLRNLARALSRRQSQLMAVVLSKTANAESARARQRPPGLTGILADRVALIRRATSPPQSCALPAKIPVSHRPQGLNQRFLSSRLHKILWLGLATLAIHGCSHTPTQLDIDRQQQNELRRIDNWQAEGKLGVRMEGDAQSAYFDWHNQADAFTLRLSGPFGQGTTWLRRKGTSVTLESADQPLRRAATAEQLMQAQLGWQVPVSNLRYWIKGLAAPRQEVTHLLRNANGTLAELHQQDWRITYSRYAMHNGWALPGKLVAERGAIKLTMIIKSWQLPSDHAR